MKGILLAGGSGSRLYPITVAGSKQLLPVYDKPTIYYPLSVLMLAGIREILIISTARDLPRIRDLFGDGKDLGLKLEYLVQPRPEGIAQAFILGEKFIGHDPVCLILGDNIFYGQELTSLVEKAAKLKEGAIIFGYKVNDPEKYGVVEVENGGARALSLEEKPKKSKSNWAVTGLYFYDGEAVKKAKRLKPSHRGELEITDLNREYMKEGKLEVICFGRGMAWLDTGSADSLLSAAVFVQTLQKRQGLQIACLEEIAFNKKFISREQMASAVDRYKNSEYGSYLEKVLNET
jgi:glucose-1-phosphate thymidylyltransferase